MSVSLFQKRVIFPANRSECPFLTSTEMFVPPPSGSVPYLQVRHCDLVMSATEGRHLVPLGLSSQAFPDNVHVNLLVNSPEDTAQESWVGAKARWAKPSRVRRGAWVRHGGQFQSERPDSVLN